MQDKITKCLGLVTQFNPLTLAPGALAKADNCYIRRENIIEDRRGYKLYATKSNNVAQLLTYRSRVLVHNGTVLSYDNGSGTFADYSGSYSAPSSARMRSVEAFSNLYATTSTGTKVFVDITGTAGRLAGAPRALDPSYTLTGSTGFLANSYQCAYRSTIQRTDANGNVVTGYPSQRLWVINAAGGTRNVNLTEYLPSEAVAGDVIQFYRTAQVSGTSTDSSADEMGLVYQYELASADISAGYVTFTDSVTDALRGATLYTSPSQEGIQAANDRPPLAKDVCLYKSNYMLYANTQTKQRLQFTLVGAAALGFATTGDTTNTSTSVANVAILTNIEIGWKVYGTGIPANCTVAGVSGSTITLSAAVTATNVGVALTFYTHRTITLGGTAYSFGSSEISSGAGSPQAQVSVTGVAATDIDLTARSLVRVINRYASNTTVYAYYLSGPDDLPGLILIEEKGVGASAFTLQGSATGITGMFYPAPPVSPSTATKSTSSSSQQKNGVYYSKAQQPEHVPPLNYLLVGPANKDILRIVALRESAIVIKEEGVYRITGETPQSFTVVPVDLTVYCKSADSVVVLANQVFMLSNQGVVAISESGVQVVSREIEPSLTPLLQASSLSSYTSAVGYESERSYFLSTITQSTDTAANQTFVYNIFTKTWVRHTYAIYSGIVEPGADKLYFAKPSSALLYLERKDFADTDYCDPEFSVTITAISSTTVTLTSTTTPVVGDVLYQGSTGIAISAVSTVSGGFSVTVQDTPPSSWATGAATVYPSVQMTIEWQDWTNANPDILKQVRAVGFFADSQVGTNSVSSLTATFRTNFDPESEEVAISVPQGGWGATWGSSPWGGAGDSNGYPTYVPRNKQYCTRLTLGVKHKNARERLSIAGCAFSFEAASDRIGR